MRSLEREFIKHVAAAQGQARRGQTRLKRHGKFTPSDTENLRQAVRKIYAKRQGKFKPNGKANSRQKAKPNLAKPKKLFLKAKSQKIGAKRYIGAKLNLVS
ncbi:hypothetical protein EP607_04980 [Campylobacter upsaliensis]|nr:hypothetical protein [Campylobacter upsaliensis]